MNNNKSFEGLKSVRLKVDEQTEKILDRISDRVESALNQSPAWITDFQEEMRLFIRETIDSTIQNEIASIKTDLASQLKTIQEIKIIVDTIPSLQQLLTDENTLLAKFRKEFKDSQQSWWDKLKG